VYECVLLLRENGYETRRSHTVRVEIAPGTRIRKEAKDWIVVEISNQGRKPEVICRPANEPT
jgi:hypothetical protein